MASPNFMSARIAVGRRIENRDAVRLADLPEATAVGKGRRAFVHEDRGARRQRPVGDVSMPGDPADVGRAPEYIAVLEVEYPSGAGLGIEQVSAAGMLDAFRSAGRSRGVEQKQGMFRIHPFRFASGALSGHRILPPHIAAGAHGAVAARAGVDDDFLHARRSHRRAPCRPRA